MKFQKVYFSFQGRSSSESPLSQYLYGPGPPGPPPSHAPGSNGAPSDQALASPPPPAHVGKL